MEKMLLVYSGRAAKSLQVLTFVLIVWLKLTYGIIDDGKYNSIYNSQIYELENHQVGRYPLLMPKVRPKIPELYLCTAIKLNPRKSYYIVGYEPNATMDTAHHMLLYGCGEQGSTDKVWDCGEMARSTGEKKYSPCSLQSQILYAWARDAPKLELPEDVGFKVGHGSPIKYIVLQVHYANIEKFRDGSTDNSGVFIRYTERPMKKLAGVLLMVTAGVIPPRSLTHMETACEITENKTIYPFAYRTHTHSLGKVVAGYKVRPDYSGMHQWTLLGKRDPLTKQMFYPVFNTDPIVMGDIVAARCTMESHRNRVTMTGATNRDEMCNFYLMYFVENGEPLERKYCYTEGPPNFYWKNSTLLLNNIPDIAASTL